MINVPKDIVNYAVICEKFPIPNAYFKTYELAKRWIEIEQPNNKPYYIIKRTEHFELCNQEENKTVKEINNVEKTGKWIKENRVLTSNPPQYVWHCSECGNPERGFSIHILTNHCPACGSKNEVTE